jgi:hypothetical protein
MPSGGPAPPPRPAPAPIPSGSGGGAGGHRRRDRIRLEYMLRKFLRLSQHELTRSPIYIALITQGIREFNGIRKQKWKPRCNPLHLTIPSTLSIIAKISIMSCVPLREFTRLIVNQAVLFHSLAISLHKDNIRCAWNRDSAKVRRR